MSGESDFCTQSELELLLSDPREGDETEVIEKGGGGGQTKRTLSALDVSDPREGDETEETQRDAGAYVSPGIVASEEADPRPGDGTSPIEESPQDLPIRV